MQCFFCKKIVENIDRVGRRDTCPHCDQDLHICKNCEFFEPTAFNECKESQAERVLEKEASNFCDYFLASNLSDASDRSDPSDDAKKKLEEMFKK